MLFTDGKQDGDMCHITTSIIVNPLKASMYSILPPFTDWGETSFTPPKLTVVSVVATCCLQSWRDVFGWSEVKCCLFSIIQ